MNLTLELQTYPHLTNYASFLGGGLLEEVAALNLQVARQKQLPLLAHFTHLPEPELLALIKRSLADFLVGMTNGQALDAALHSLQQWKQGALPGIGKGEVQEIDMTLVYSIRRIVLLTFLPRYTSDPELIISISLELEDFYSHLQQAAFHTYLEVQQEQLRQERDFFQTVIDHTLEGITTYDREFRVTHWNRAVAERTGISKEQVLGKNIFEVMPSYLNLPVGAGMQEALNGKLVQVREQPYQGREGYYEADVIPLKDKEGLVTGILTVSRDISSLIQATKALQHSENRLKEAQAQAHLGHWEVVLATGQTWWSEELYRIYEIEPGTPLSREQLKKYFPPGEIARIEAKSIEALHQGTPFSFELPLHLSDGRVKYLNTKMEFEKDAFGSPLKVKGITQDITQMKQVQLALHARNQELGQALEELTSTQEALQSLNDELEGRVMRRTQELAASEEELRQTLEQAMEVTHRLQESEHFLSSILDQTPLSTWISDAQGTMIRINQACLDLFGIPDPDLVVGKANLLADNTLLDKPFYPDIQAVFSEGKVAHFELNYDLRKVDHVQVSTAKPVSLEVTIFPIRNTDGQITNAVIQHLDITERNQALFELREREERLRAIFDQSIVGICLADMSGRFTLVNEQYCRITGYAANELLQKTILEVTFPEDRLRNVENFRLMLSTGKGFTMEKRYVRPDGELVWVYNSVSIIYGPNGQPTSTMAICQDITDKKRAEANLEKALEESRRVNEQLRRTNIDLDNFIYTASHDLKSPITNMEGLTSLLKRRLGESGREKEKDLLGMFDHSISRLKATIKDLAEITQVQKDQEQAEEPVFFPDVFSSIKSDLSPLIEATQARIEAQFTIPAINFTRRNLRSVLQNLLENALKYRSPHRTPVIQLQTFRQENQVVLSVQDNGLGISANQVPKLFMMFRRLHTHQEGTGIGLYLVKRILENHGGRVEVKSREGEGTTFYVYFKE